MIQISELTASYSKANSSQKVLGPLSLSIGHGEFVSIVGPSGCGKSTLAKVLIGMHLNYGGNFSISAPKNKISIVFQDYGVFPWKTALENISFAVREQGKTSEEAKEIAKYWLNRFRLTEFEDFYPAALSGGMKQRLSMARALSIDPEVLILDEPFAAIDTQLREVLQEELLELQQEKKITTIQITHNYDEAILLSDRIVVLSALPASLKLEVDVDIQRPRTAAMRESAIFSNYRQSLRDSLRSGASE